MRSNLNADADTIASDDFFATWRKITFSPREFFAQFQDKPTRPGPVVFALIVALVAACGSTLVALVFSKGEMTAGAIFGAVFRAVLGTLVGAFTTTIRTRKKPIRCPELAIDVVTGLSIISIGSARSDRDLAG
ncbi:MAG TPA: hypothetical protein PK156_14535 [Polyangium sp.]|nr:hypothetical protein [Polyangium sp.]